ncbi:MAG: nuclease-related domain-containing protein [Lysinibacillus sp.]
MLLIKREVSHKQQVLEAIIRRLPAKDANYVYFEEMLRRTRAGLAGEQRVDEEWKEIEVNCPYYLLHNLELLNDVGSTHQIDTLFICPYFAFVVEIKNIVGQIDFNEEFHQFTRTTMEGKIDGFSNPFDQVQRHVRFLNNIFTKLNIKMPIVHAVISANRKTIMAHNLITQEIFHVSGLSRKVEKFFQAHPEVCLDDKKLKYLVKRLKKMHNPKQWNPNLDSIKLQKGVLCPQCEFRNVMRYQRGKWYCDVCQRADNQAIYYALQDYRLLVDETISNSEFCAYCHIASSKAAYKKLLLLKLEQVGELKQRRYLIPKDIGGKSS